MSRYFAIMNKSFQKISCLNAARGNFLRTFLCTSLGVGLLSAMLLSGCASSRGFNRGSLRESIEQKAVVDDKEIAKALARKAQLPKPFKIAIHLSAPTSSNYRTPEWRWGEAEKTQLLKLADGLKASGEVSDVFIMNPDTASGESLKALRLAAARHGADALLIVSGVKDVDTYANNWAWTYIALVPMLFVPGTQSDVLFLARATLWDVRNEFLYMSAESESIQKERAPVAMIDDKSMTEMAKTEAVAKLSDEITSQIKGIATIPLKKRKSQTN
jgi:hypothetical protein